MWKKKASHTLLEHPRLTVSEDDVELESGETIQYIRYGYKGSGAVIVVVNDRDEVLFLREYSYLPNKQLLQLPMGKVSEDEDPEVGARRELQEEAGFEASSLTLAGRYYQNHRRSDNQASVFLASGLTKVATTRDKEEEDMSTVWIHKDTISSQIDSGDICDADTLATLRICRL